MDLPLHLLSDNFIRTKHITKETPFEIKTVDAKSLVCAARFDLAAKIAYIEARESGGDMAFARELYRKHIEAFSEGYFVEPGDPNKNTLEKFFSVFDELIDDYKANGFNEKKSLVPVGENNTILDGAHRTACAVYFGGTVTVISFPQFKVRFDYRFFRERKLSEEMLEYMAVVYSRYSVNPLYLACLWPVATSSKCSGAIEQIEKKHGIVFETPVTLKKNGLRNFMLQIYQHQDWIGTPENHFSGVMGKVDVCFAPNSATQAVLFEGGSLEEVLLLKEQIRDVFQLGKHAIHISDTNEETQLMASLLFNSNSRHALNFGKPDIYQARFCELKSFHGSNKLLNNSATLAFYGIENDGEICESKETVCFNPREYFIFDGIRLPAIHVVKQSYVGENTKVISELARAGESNRWVNRIEDVRTSLNWWIKKLVLRCKQFAMKVTQKLGIYELLHSLHHR